MAAIASTIASKAGAFAAPETPLSASDTITFSPSRKQLLTLRNTTASPVVVTLDGADGTTVQVGGLGSVSVAAGLAITVPANARMAVVLGTVRLYCQGVVALTGGVGVSVSVIDL